MFQRKDPVRMQGHPEIQSANADSSDKTSDHGCANGAQDSDKGAATKSLEDCSEVLKELFHKKHSTYAWPFYAPVDAEALGLADYHTIITEPMDLSTVKKKLEGKKYSTAMDFERDVLLIFQNCYKYNPPENDVVIMAKKVEEMFKDRMSKPIKKRANPVYITSTAATKKKRELALIDADSDDESGITGDDSAWGSSGRKKGKKGKAGKGKGRKSKKDDDSD